jgi:ABC-type transport system involved in cytochrome c biogenesis permease subunit
MSLFMRRHLGLFATAGGFFIAGFAMLVAGMGESNPAITALMPVLHSPLLCIHVAVIMISYALLMSIALNGVTALLLHRRSEVVRRLRTVSNLMLYPALFLLAGGIFVGAIWANQSWGCYWSWDPKETWALITLFVYAIPLHQTSLVIFRRDCFFHGYVTCAFLAVLITYFGVNYLLGGMHSYAG